MDALPNRLLRRIVERTEIYLVLAHLGCWISDLEIELLYSAKPKCINDLVSKQLGK
jgi:hypothetical protein